MIFHMDGAKGVRGRGIGRGRVVITELIKGQGPLGLLGFVKILASTLKEASSYQIVLNRDVK